MSKTSKKSPADPDMLQRDTQQSSWFLMKRLMRDYLAPHRTAFIGAMALMVIGSSVRGIFALTLQLVIDGLTQKRGLGYIMWLSGFIVAIFTVRGAANYFQNVLMNKFGQRVVTQIQQDMYQHMLHGDLAFFHANSSGTLVSRIINDVAVMRSTVSESLLNSFKGGLDLCFLIAAMFYEDWQIAIAVFIIFPVSAIYVSRLTKRLRRLSTNTQVATGELSALLSQTLQGIRHVKAYGNEDKEHKRVLGATETIYRLAVKNVRISSVSGPVMEVISSLAIAGLVIFGYWQFDHGTSTPGNLIAFIMSFFLAYDPLKRMGRVNSQFQAGLASAERIFALLDTEPTIVDAANARPLATADYSIALEDISFDYADGTRALDHLTINVPHGKTVAIVGASGAGKSTIINLIPRFYDVQKGQIRIGSVPLTELALSSLRSHIALVSQETALFDDTVQANIAYGKTDATLAEIETAAISAFADGFIKELPLGYDTVVGEHGVKLSGGQRQRIAIARAMLRNAPILLLDEATSALDNESERAVQAALKRLQEGRTTIVVAHRLSTIVDADRIVVLERGAVVEAGTHAQLLARQGVYARLYGMQSRAPDNISV